jgi:hypothetical protein
MYFTQNQKRLLNTYNNILKASGANPMITSYNASAGKNYNTANSVERF